MSSSYTQQKRREGLLQTSRIEGFMTLVWPLTIIEKLSILNIWRGSVYATVPAFTTNVPII